MSEQKLFGQDGAGTLLRILRDSPAAAAMGSEYLVAVFPNPRKTVQGVGEYSAKFDLL